MDMIRHCGDNTHIDPSVEIFISNYADKSRGVFIGSHCMLYPRTRFVLGNLDTNLTADLHIGDHVHINAGGYLSAEGGLTIGDRGLIGPNVCILSAGHLYQDANRTIQEQGLSYGTITIDADVWIGAAAVILQDVTIGKGAVIGAGTVVRQDVPPNAVVVGNPGRIIQYRGQPMSQKKSAVYRLLRYLKALKQPEAKVH